MDCSLSSGACRLDSLNVTRHTRICSVHFEGGLDPTKLNPVPSIFAFPQHLQRKLPKSRADPKEGRRRQRKETPQPSKKHRHAKRARVIFCDKSIRRTVYSNDLVKFFWL